MVIEKKPSEHTEQYGLFKLSSGIDRVFVCGIHSIVKTICYALNNIIFGLKHLDKCERVCACVCREYTVLPLVDLSKVIKKQSRLMDVIFFSTEEYAHYAHDIFYVHLKYLHVD